MAVVLSKFKRLFVIIFFWKDLPQSEGSRHADPKVKLLPATKSINHPFNQSAFRVQGALLSRLDLHTTRN